MKEDFKTEIKLLNHPLISKPGINKLLGISRGQFHDKLNENNGQRFTDAQKKEIRKQLLKLMKLLSKM